MRQSVPHRLWCRRRRSAATLLSEAPSRVEALHVMLLIHVARNRGTCQSLCEWKNLVEERPSQPRVELRTTILAALAYLSNNFAATRLRTKFAGIGRSSGNCTVPFNVLKSRNSFVNRSIADPYRAQWRFAAPNCTL